MVRVELRRRIVPNVRIDMMAAMMGGGRGYDWSGNMRRTGAGQLLPAKKDGQESDHPGAERCRDHLAGLQSQRGGL